MINEQSVQPCVPAYLINISPYAQQLVAADHKMQRRCHQAALQDEATDASNSGSNSTFAMDALLL
jgi:hypothetical protein